MFYCFILGLRESWYLWDAWYFWNTWSAWICFIWCICWNCIFRILLWNCCIITLWNWLFFRFFCSLGFIVLWLCWLCWLCWLSWVCGRYFYYCNIINTRPIIKCESSPVWNSIKTYGIFNLSCNKSIISMWKILGTLSPNTHLLNTV